jgi:hypothetical protein
MGRIHSTQIHNLYHKRIDWLIVAYAHAGGYPSQRVDGGRWRRRAVPEVFKTIVSARTKMHHKLSYDKGDVYDNKKLRSFHVCTLTLVIMPTHSFCASKVILFALSCRTSVIMTLWATHPLIFPYMMSQLNIQSPPILEDFRFATFFHETHLIHMTTSEESLRVLFFTRSLTIDLVHYCRLTCYEGHLSRFK